MEIAIERGGPKGYWCCPTCGNWEDNGIPQDRKFLRRCAKCKVLFEIGADDPAKLSLIEEAEKYRERQSSNEELTLVPKINQMFPMVSLGRIKISRRRKSWIVQARLSKIKMGQVRSFCEHMPRTIRTSRTAHQYALGRCIHHWPHLEEIMGPYVKR